MIKISTPWLSVGRFYNVSPETVWDLITDTEKWPQRGPTVNQVDCSDRFIAKGTRGRVQTSIGLWLPFVVTEYEHGRFWSWEVASIRATGHRIQTFETGGCILWFEVPIFTAPYILVCQIALGRIEALLLNSEKNNRLIKNEFADTRFKSEE